MLAALEGHGAPALIDAGEDALGPWLVMELVDAPALSMRLKSLPVRARDAGWTERATRGVFTALASVHARGVVHSDLSPGNILVGDESWQRPGGPDRDLANGRSAKCATLVDFGLARWLGAPPLPPGPFRGTLLYASPELARGEPIDPRADLFAAAASLLHAHSGEAPRAHTTDAAILLSAGDEPIDAWAARASDGLSLAVRESLRACCAFDVTVRPATAQDLLVPATRL